MKNGIIKVYYGDGKGKTTAAIGQGIMAASEERSVIIIQFLKSRNREEMSFISRLEPEIKLFQVMRVMKLTEAIFQAAETKQVIEFQDQV